tara:strand:+ start:2553 stop:4307 length:1755 start_codon:yes stop_codon:yes gene_type:complete
MAIPNLFQTADANLSAMSYKMSEAKTPGDHSLIYARMADSYRQTMLSVGNVWGSVMKAATPFIKEAAGNFAEKSKYQTLMGQEKYENSENVNHFLNGMDLNIENEDGTTTTSRYKGLNEISQGLRNTWLEGNPLSQENKVKRMQLNKEKDQLYADVDLLEAGFAHIGETLNSGKYSEDALRGVYGDSRFIAAASAFNNPSGKADNGDYLIPSRDKNGNLILGLYGKNGEPVDKMAGQPEHGFVSYKASEIGDLVTPDFPKVRASGSKLFDDVIKSIAGGGSIEIEGNKFQNNLNEIVRDPKALQFAIYEKRFSHFQTSMVDDLMANKGRSSNLSATIFQSVLDTLGTDAEGNALLPTDENGKPIDIDLGSNGVFDKSDFSLPDGVGLDNYTKFASAIQNKHNPYYNEELTRGVFLHWARDKAMQQAQVVKGQTPKPKMVFDNDFRKEQNKSASTARNILQAVQAGDFNNLVLSPKTTGGDAAVVRWNPTKKMYQVERGNKVSTTFEPTNNNIRYLMSQSGVLGFHIDQMQSLGYFNQPMWRGSSQQMRNLYPGMGAPPGADNTKYTSVGDEIYNNAFKGIFPSK